MSLLTFRDRGSEGQPVGPVYYLEFDAATVEEFSRNAEISVYPVETGAVLSDHYQPQPRQISLEGVVSDTPARFYVPLEAKINAAPPPIVTPLVLANVITTLVRGAPDRVSTFFQVIDGLMENRVPVDVVMLDGVEFRDFMITNHRAPRVAGQGGSVTFSLDLQQVVFANPAESVQVAAQRSEPEVQQKRKRGRVAPKPATSDARSSAILDKLTSDRILEISRGAGL